MKSSTIKTVAPIVIMLAAIAGTALLVISRPDAKQEHIPPNIPLVEATRVNKQSISIPVLAQGNVKARTTTQLLADVSGRVLEVSSQFDAGAYFRKGAIIARIDDRHYVAAVKRAKASVASARSALALEKGHADVAKKEWQTRAKNVERSQDATDLYLRKPQLEEAQARLESAQADLLQARVDLDHTVVKAPYDCMIMSKAVDIGQSVTPGAPITTIFAIDRAQVRVPLSEKELQFIDLTPSTDQTNAPRVELSSTVGSKTERWQGKLVRTEGVLDERTRSMAAIIEVEDPYGLLGNEQHRLQPLRIGTFVSASIVGRPFNDLVELSQAALKPGNKVWVIDEQQKLNSRVLEVLSRNDESVYISAGLENGELVSLTSLSNFVTGTEVRIAHIDGAELKSEHTAVTDSLTLSDAAPNEDHKASPDEIKSGVSP